MAQHHADQHYSGSWRSRQRDLHVQRLYCSWYPIRGVPHFQLYLTTDWLTTYHHTKLRWAQSMHNNNIIRVWDKINVKVCANTKFHHFFKLLYEHTKLVRASTFIMYTVYASIACRHCELLKSKVQPSSCSIKIGVQYYGRLSTMGDTCEWHPMQEMGVAQNSQKVHLVEWL